VPNPVPSPEVRSVAGRRPGVVYEFGEFCLDCGRSSWCATAPAARGAQADGVADPAGLAGGQLVTRQEIAERLWSSEVFVDTEHGINTAIRKLRHLLRDDPGDPHFIQTVTGMGYRFVAPVSAAMPDLPVEVTPEPALATALPSRRRLWAGMWERGLRGPCVRQHGLYRARHRPPEVRYTQLTDFTDSAVAPALSTDGQMVAFIRGGNGFLTSDQIYVKMLPNGEAKLVTDDERPKYGLAFSPDGSEIAYTVLERSGFSTYEVSALGGEPHLLLKNAADWCGWTRSGCSFPRFGRESIWGGFGNGDRRRPARDLFPRP